MQAQLRLIQNDERGEKPGGLQQQRRQGDEPERAVRQGRSIEVGVRSPVAPLQPDLVLVQCLRLQDEVVKERRHEAYRTADHLVRAVLLATQIVQERGKIRSIAAEATIVIDICSSLDRSGSACVQKVRSGPILLKLNKRLPGIRRVICEGRRSAYLCFCCAWSKVGLQWDAQLRVIDVSVFRQGRKAVRLGGRKRDFVAIQVVVARYPDSQLPGDCGAKV